MRRRRCEWEQSHNHSWRSAGADHAEWMFGKSRARLAPVLTEASSWMSDQRAQNPLRDRRQHQCVATVVEQLKKGLAVGGLFRPVLLLAVAIGIGRRDE
jgi:hypothetical protein